MAGTRSQVRRCQPLMGTFAEVSLAGERSESQLQGYANAAFAELRRLEQRLSFHRTDSELSSVNRDAVSRSMQISDDMRNVLREALWLSELSNGLFDITVAVDLMAMGLLPVLNGPTTSGGDWRCIQLEDNLLRFTAPLLIDLGGIAKGYAVDCALQQVPEDVRVCINVGGDLRMRPWQQQTVHIRYTRECGDGLFPALMRAPALATSAGRPGRQLGTIIDPHSHLPANQPHTWSVFADTAMRADGLTKLAVLGGAEHPALARAGGDLLLIDAGGRVRAGVQ